MFLFDRKAVRFFRKDSHNWRKKADGKTVRETHEKLKVLCIPALLKHSLADLLTDVLRSVMYQVGNVEMLNCYYAHADRNDGLQVSSALELQAKVLLIAVCYLLVPVRL